MKAVLIRDMPKMIRLPKGEMKVVPKGNPKGTVIDDPRAYLLVRQGVASPIDKECSDKAGMSSEHTKRCWPESNPKTTTPTLAV
jgi:hypothetical protein